MEFSYNNYNVQVVLNPVDFILRFEDKETLQLFETICFERDFIDYLPFGGIGFVQKVLMDALKEECDAISSLQKLSVDKSHLTFELVYQVPLLLKPIIFSFDLKAIRREKAGADMDAIQRKIKELTAFMESTMTASSALAVKVKELEERCGDVITLPGCPFVIPIDSISVTLVKDGTEMFEGGQGFIYSSSFPGRKAEVFGLGGGGKINAANIFTTNYSGNHRSITLKPSPNTFVFDDDLTNITNLKFLKNCTSITLSGCSKVSDYSILSTLTKLQNLCIIDSRNTHYATTNVGTSIQNGSAGNNPQLKDISWIRVLKNLRTVSFQGCSQLVDITPLKDLPHLTNLDVRETGVKNTEFLTHAGLTIVK
jgi:hypothetical protein